MILLTGGTGFVGKAVAERIESTNLRLLVRSVSPEKYVNYVYGTIDAHSDYSQALDGVEIVIHTAAKAHVMEPDFGCVHDYQNTNVDGALNLARQAALNGVKRFIFISSIKVNGEANNIGSPFHFDDGYSPQDIYAQSKVDAECGLKKIAHETEMELVIIRPPLVYGPGVKGNFLSMMKIINKNIPLPLGGVDNVRSLVALDNLVDLIITCIDHPKAANQTFLVSDDQDVSTTELLKKMASAFGKKSRLIPVPMGLIQLVASLLGKRAVAQRLCSSLVVDISHTKKTLNWKPPVTMEQQLAKIATSLSTHSG